jgi:signal peptidase I
MTGLRGVAVSVRDEAGGVLETLGDRPHRLGLAYGGGPDLPPTRVPAERYLVLGDNRGNSRDGRSFGWVARDAILGRAAAVRLHGGKPTWNSL